jgi:dual specificity protein kinase YAK1
MQPDQYQSYPNQATSSTSSRHVPPAQAGPPSFYGAGVVPAGQAGGSSQQRNPFPGSDASQQPMTGAKDVRRGGGMDVWPR